MASLRSLSSELIQRHKFQPGFWALFTNHNYLSRYELLGFVKKIGGHSRGLVVDVGCGSKPYQSYLEHDRYFGVDVDTGAHAHDNEDIDLFYDGVTLPFQSGGVDTVVCFEVLEHVEDMALFLAELNRILKPGGKLILTMPFFWPEHEQPYDFRRLTSFGLKKELEAAIGPLVVHEKLGTGWRAWFGLFNNLIAQLWQRGPKLLRAMIWIAARPLIFGANALGFLVGRLGTGPEAAFYFGNAVVVEKKQD